MAEETPKKISELTELFLPESKDVVPIARIGGGTYRVSYQNLSRSEINLCPNPLFEYWDATPDLIGWWKTDATLTWAQESTTVKQGSRFSLKITKGADTEERLGAVASAVYNTAAYYKLYENRPVVIGVWCYVNDAGATVKAGFRDSIGTTYSRPLTTVGEFQWLEIVRATQTGITWFAPTLSFTGNTGDIFYISQPHISLGSTIGRGNFQPAINTTIGDHIGIATDAQAVTGTLDTVVITPGNLTARLEQPGNIGDITPVPVLTVSNSGLHIQDTNGSHDLVVRAGSDLTADRSLYFTTGDANRTLTLSGDLTVESASLINQDLTTDSTTAALGSLNLGVGELTAGSINRASGTLTIEIGGTAEISVTSTASTFGGNIVIPNAGYIGTSSTPLSIQIEGDGDISLPQKLGVGATPTHKFLVSGNEAGEYIAKFFNDGDDPGRAGIVIQAGADDAAGITYFIGCFDGDGDAVGVIEIAAGSFQLTPASDERIKKNIVDTSIDALEIVNGLRFRDYDMKKSGHHITCSLVAQEVENVYPRMVSQNVGGSGYKGISYDPAVPLIGRAVQQLSENMEKLLARMDKLEAV